MKTLFKATILMMFASIGSTSAQGLMGTSKSFSTTAFCGTYKCQLLSSGNGQWLYATKFKDMISVIRQSSDPSSKIKNVILAIINPDSDYYAEDNKTFKALQVQVLGSVKTDLLEDCYSSSQLKVMKVVMHGGKEYHLQCGNTAAGLLIGISPAK